MKRFPPRDEIIDLLFICVFIFHIWSIPVFLYQVPGMFLYMSIWELILVFAYNQAAILLECLFFTGVIALTAAALPPDLIKKRFVFQGTFILLLSAVCSIMFNQMEPFILKILPAWGGWIGKQGVFSPETLGLLGSDSFIYSILLVFLLSAWLSAMVLSPSITKRFSSFASPIRKFADRISILSSLFILVDSLGLLIVLINNLN